MTKTVAPFEDVAFTEATWRAIVSRLATSGVVADPGSTACQVYADSTGMQVKVRVCPAAILQGTLYAEDAEQTKAIGANAAGSVRFDLIVLRLNPTGNTVTIEVKAGTAGGAAPTVERTTAGTWELPLAVVTVDPGAVTIAPGKVRDVREFSGLDIIPCTSTTRPLSPRKFQLIVENDTGIWRYWSGAAWAVFIDPANTVTTTQANMRDREFIDTVQGPSGATSFTNGSPSGTFVAPPSGRMRVSLFAEMWNSGAFVTSFGYRMYAGSSGAGALVVVAADSRALRVEGTDLVAGGGTFLVQNLTPGATYFIIGAHMVTGGVGTFDNRRILVEPAF